MFVEILKYGFLAIFFATALLGLASIPEWIKIPEWYRKRIFIALILEVVGVIIILFNQELIGSGSTGIPDIRVQENGWVALNDKGIMIRPEVIVTTKDTAITKVLGNQSYMQFEGLTGSIIENGLSIRNADSASLGVIKAIDLAKNGLFNSFKTARGEITSNENYSYIKWEKKSAGQWQKTGAFIGPFELEVNDHSNGTHYYIKNKIDGTYVFDSKNISRNLISLDNRIIHFLEHKNIYYLLRIAMANLDTDDAYIHVLNIKIEPTLKSH